MSPVTKSVFVSAMACELTDYKLLFKPVIMKQLKYLIQTILVAKYKIFECK